MKNIYKNNEADLVAQEAAPQERVAGVDLQKCTEEEFWQEVKYSANDRYSER